MTLSDGKECLRAEENNRRILTESYRATQELSQSMIADRDKRIAGLEAEVKRLKDVLDRNNIIYIRRGLFLPFSYADGNVGIGT